MKDVAILKMADIINDKVRIDDTCLALLSEYPVNISDNFKEYFDCLDDTYIARAVIKAMNIITEDISYYWKTKNNRVLNSPTLTYNIAKYIGEENAETFLDLVAHYYNNYPGIPMNITHYKNTLYARTVAHVGIMLGFMLIGMLLVTDREQLDKWCNYNGSGLIGRTRGAISLITQEKTEDIVQLGRLSFLPEEEKKNIIGSLWNCIIDILNRTYTIKVEEYVENEKGGEE